jgi:hypothetical protein
MGRGDFEVGVRAWKDGKGAAAGTWRMRWCALGLLLSHHWASTHKPILQMHHQEATRCLGFGFIVGHALLFWGMQLAIGDGLVWQGPALHNTGASHASPSPNWGCWLGPVLLGALLV